MVCLWCSFETRVNTIATYRYFLKFLKLFKFQSIHSLLDTSRLLFATWWIFITILTAFYTANLTAFLTLSRFTLPISKPEDIGQKKYSWVSHKGSAISDAVKPVKVFSFKYINLFKKQHLYREKNYIQHSKDLLQH